MSTSSDIEWTDATWNPVSGCTRASAGCDNCYAVKQTYRLERMGQRRKYGGLTVLNKAGDRHFNGVVRTDEGALSTPLAWKKPRRIFVNSMSDLFHRDVPFEFIDKVFAVMALTPQHTYQVLTKRPERMAEYLNRPEFETALRIRSILANADSPHPTPEAAIPLRNVWLGTSVENQEAADERIPHLLRCPAAVRFLSCEPLLGRVELGLLGTVPRSIRESYTLTYQLLHWVIVGGESGPGARPCDVEWVRDIVEECKTAAVHVFVKQFGTNPVVTCYDYEKPLGQRYYTTSVRNEFPTGKGGKIEEFPEDLRVRESPREAVPA